MRKASPILEHCASQEKRKTKVGLWDQRAKGTLLFFSSQCTWYSRGKDHNLLDTFISIFMVQNCAFSSYLSGESSICFSCFEVLIVSWPLPIITIFVRGTRSVPGVPLTGAYSLKGLWVALGKPCSMTTTFPAMIGKCPRATALPATCQSQVLVQYLYRGAEDPNVLGSRMDRAFVWLWVTPPPTKGRACQTLVRGQNPDFILSKSCLDTPFLRGAGSVSPQSAVA